MTFLCTLGHRRALIDAGTPQHAMMFARKKFRDVPGNIHVYRATEDDIRIFQAGVIQKAPPEKVKPEQTDWVNQQESESTTFFEPDLQAELDKEFGPENCST